MKLEKKKEKKNETKSLGVFLKINKINKTPEKL